MMTRSISRLALRAGRPLAFALVLVGAAACAGDGSDADADDTAEIKATEANARQHGFKEHVVKAASASEATKSLGIATWDVFSGQDAATGVFGAVFYASDAAGDVRYAFSVDVATQQMAFVILHKDGTPVMDGGVDEASYAKLQADVVALKERLATSESRATACATAIALGALTLVVGAGVAYAAIPVFFVGGVSAMALSGTLGTAVGVVSGTAAPAVALITLLGSVGGLAAGYAYGAYVAVSSVVAPAIDKAKACFTPSPSPP